MKTSGSERDRTERSLLEWAVNETIPTFGVCRGMHAINSFFGGSISKKTKTATEKHVNHVSSQHTIELKALPALSLHAGTYTTNSYHNNCIVKDDLADNIDVYAYSEDGVIEAFGHRRFPIWAVQWHPERDGSCSDVDDILIREILKRVKHIEQ